MGNPESDSEPGFLRGCLGYLKSAAVLLLLTTGLFLGSYPQNPPPEDQNVTTGFVTLYYLTPLLYEETFRFWTMIAGMMIVFALMYLPRIQAVLNTRLIQYMGKISFALYLVHGSITRSLGYAFCHWGWRVLKLTDVPLVPLDYKNPHDRIIMDRIDLMKGGVVVVGFMIVMPVTLWLADIFWRVVDMPSVRFARWVETKLLEA
ncbi:hypothetical protein ABW20_dc0109488 [Dactylellina cionopaga]|nr:hypothetical protein ABW20_dc0109488 [Dactylellina cionopaga]